MKKILNIFASISLITSGVSSVVACGSHYNPNPPTPPPPKSESQKLFDELNETKTAFTIRDDDFWGNEANYQNDLLTDLEKAAHITSQEDKNLLHDTNVKPLTKQGDQIVDINIDGLKKIAKVKIDWELTESQSVKGLFKFYTQTWPKTTAKYGSNLLSLFYGGWDKTKKSPNWKKGDPLGWWKYDKRAAINNHLSWNNNLNTEIKKYLSNLTESIQIPTSIQNMLNVIKPSTIKDGLDINKSYNIPLNDIYLLSHGVKYNLGYYASYDATKSLLQMQSWNISYDTGYNLMQNELKNTIIKLLKRGLYKPYTASNNAGYIKDKLSDAGYSFYTPYMTFNGNIKTDGTPSPIEVYYKKVDLGFTIKVKVLDL